MTDIEVGALVTVEQEHVPIVVEDVEVCSVVTIEVPAPRIVVEPLGV